MVDLARAAAAIHEGEVVVYPTETVYGLAADALSASAVEQVFAVKGRDRSKPISLAVPDVETATEYTRPTAQEKRFMNEFLPGPVTVLVEAREAVPDVLTAGGDQVGIRVPDHPTALALLREVAPLTATSANVSGNPSARRVEDVDAAVREASAAVIDGGNELPGTESTVVDVSEGTIHRRGARADEITAWLDRSEE
ncbi:L-threonylcarbamoyladenylate synthase [Halococcus saccharolyticus]|uniref:L-threonylcarbamoyladenylate synthase n=1 Tax=Halococcus saccharolyticus DSM 5350 TaxID=1227455 RepID=M0MFV2_9EURY|nr:L-threonylcarbamoyladenylate synthase [Halococcus saccharolyticus]EMA44248.1 Sua5/YciO/YrdC/YwlC family protein [Halococcus saccharolyticus DSM 5350]